ncbi:hypothetical protein DP113_01410 [Brasilonema octagenarum UFV-E1]|uniref:Uncharacterized protein n=2 Tax=Brasilonema TaxID=383614 RepID=A0A856MCP4_9CYAN|nr:MULTISPECIES: hypothetical protein [Brasilonema]NMF66114.1 hypothetical protein [Brasilonema octagenarum UFV-OR1]QDL06746.1 hypothetical protein DP114_01420 [Brasilonema sennae CENA114]QDL13115.1 hypothetical protein DP113_01410 [Brasilonema octagenarum UFV-E1]
MVPDLPIFNHTIYHSGFTESFYDPRTLLTKILAPNLEGQEKKEFVLRGFEYNATVIHERVHWFQHHGTSFGCFLEALRLSQQNTTLRWLREMPSSRVRDFLRQRVEFTTPILEIDPQTRHPIFAQGDEHDQMNLFRQIWFDHQWVHAVFEDSRISKQLGKPPGTVIGEVVGDVMLALCAEHDFLPQTKNAILTTPLTARQWFSVDDTEMMFVSISGMYLTSKILMECAATISELQLLPESLWMPVLGKAGVETVLTNRIKTILDGDYGIPIRSLLVVLNAGLDRLLDVLPTVNVLCFIALNPPLPPYVMHPPDDAPSWRWQDIYPPIRFARLALCVKKVGLLSDCRDHRTIATYIDKLCDVCQLPHTINTNYPDRISYEETPCFADENTVYSDSLKFSHHDYIFWVQSCLMRYRLNALPLMVSFGDCLSGDLLKQYVNDVLNFDAVPFSRCPLGWTKNDKLGFSCSVDFGNWLFRSILMDYVLFDVVAGTGKYDLSSFPGEINQNEIIYEFLEKNIILNLTEVRNT